jgi:hypothetical protein
MKRKILAAALLLGSLAFIANSGPGKDKSEQAAQDKHDRDLKAASDKMRTDDDHGRKGDVVFKDYDRLQDEVGKQTDDRNGGKTDPKTSSGGA